ncbi:MAG: peptidylprolyl isomerase [Clostridia bacterium]
MKTGKIILADERQINFELYENYAPLSVANFVELANSGFYKGLIFHRVIENFMIQGGGMDKNMKQKFTVKTVKGEFYTNGVKNDLKHTLGVLSMARTQEVNSASSQFFICVANTPHLDGQYAGFGKVCDKESLDICLDIAKVDTGSCNHYSDVPKTPIIIKDIVID